MLYNKYNILYYFLTYIIFFFSILYYFRSLKGCDGDFLFCSNKTQINFYIDRVYELLLSICLFSISLLLQIILKISKYNYLIYIIFYSFIFYYNQGMDFFSHGTYNFLFFIFIFPICLLYFYIFYLFAYYIYYQKNKNIFFLSILFLIHIIIYTYMLKCDNFEMGLGGIKINNDLNYNACKIVKPQKCGINVLDGLFDISKLLIKNNCFGYSNKQSIFQKYLKNNKKNHKKYSFPRTELLDINTTFRNLENYVEKNIEVINSNNSINKEIFINFENGKGKIEINLKKNLNLIKSRSKLSKNNTVKFNNVYIIYIDGISRNHFLRKLKKTSKLIEKMLYSNKNKEKQYQNFNSFQFLKYHVFKDNTMGNNFPFIYGNYMNNETGISMTKFFKEKGFITASTYNSCNRELFDWGKKQYKNLIFTGWDHENFAMFCDTNFVDKKQKWSITKGKNSVIRKCLYGKDSFEYEFEYILQFLEAYKNERKFFKIGFGDAHEGTLEVIKYIDEPLANFLEIIITKYFDNKTAIFFLSDHGANLLGFHDIFFYKEKKIEKYLAMLFIILPENNDNYNKTAISINQQRLITPFDIHDTLLDMINIDKKKYHQMIDRGQSLFKEINGLNRTCENYDKQIPKDVCFCK